MSIEALIAANTAALERLTAVLQSQQITPAADAPAAATDKPKRTTKKDTPAADTKETPAAGAQTGSPTSNDASVNDGKKLSVKLQSGDPEGTRYFHIAQHNTVAAVKPAEVIPSISGIVEIDGDEYTALKAKYSAAMVPSGNGAAAGSAPTATPTASSNVAGSSPEKSAIDATTLTEKFKKLHARDGNEGLGKVLAHFNAKRVGELTAQTAKHAEIDAHLEGLLNPTAAPDLF